MTVDCSARRAGSFALCALLSGSLYPEPGLCADPSWSLTGSLNVARSSHQATLLSDGRVLVSGGQAPSGLAVAPAEVFDAATGTWSLSGSNRSARYDHTATLLGDGRVLVTGGVGSNVCTSNRTTELFDPTAGTWSPGPDAPVALGTGHNAIRLRDGRVLVTGGGDRCGAVFATAALFDPNAGTWTTTESMSVRRTFHSASLLADGRVLVAGGVGQNAVYQSIADAEVYDPSTEKWTVLAPMASARSTSCNGYLQGFLALLPDERVLTAAADRTIPPRGCLGSQTRDLTTATEIFHPATGTWGPGGTLAVARAITPLTPLADGRILVAGGTDGTRFLASAELFDPTTGTWMATAPMSSPRAGHTATRLQDGRVLVVSGGTAEIFSTGVLGRRIPVGSGPNRAVITSDGREVYVSNFGSDSVSVIDVATETVTHTIGVGRNPDSLAISPDGARIFVGQHGGNISVIDTATKALGSFTVGAPVRDLAPSADGRRLFVARERGGLWSVDTLTGAAAVLTGTSCPEATAVSPDGLRLFVNYQCAPSPGASGHDPIYVFSAVSGAFQSAIAFLRDGRRIPNVGSALSVSPDGSQVWANGLNACSDPHYDHVGCPIVPGGVVNVVGTSDFSVVRTLGFAEGVGRVSLSPDGRRAYVGGSVLRVFDTATFDQVATIPVPASGSLAFTPNGHRAFAPVPAENAVRVLALESGVEVCDGADNDGDGQVDEGLSTDADRDGHYVPGSCLIPADDCDDANPTLGACNTPVSDQPITFEEQSGGVDVAVTLPPVTNAGNTTVQVDPGCSQTDPEGLFFPGQAQSCVVVETTASACPAPGCTAGGRFEPPAEVCIGYAGLALTDAEEDGLRMVRCGAADGCALLTTHCHNKGGPSNEPVCTLPGPDVLCALTEHFSGFALGIPTDGEGDGVVDLSDNCTLVVNPTQTDTDRDGYGNACDADFNNDGIVTAADYVLLRAKLNTATALFDLNGDGFVTAADYLLLRARLNQPPGPRGVGP